MTLMTWTAAQFATKITQTDDEHQKIFAMVNDLHANVGSDRSSVGSKLDALIAFVAKHFQTEESLMKAHAYPDFDTHKAAHDALVSTCLDLQKKFKAGEAEITPSTTEFVKDWLYSHIPAIDKNYGPYLNAKGVS
jgi:hemerythrin